MSEGLRSTPLSGSELAVIDLALDDLTNLALLYERRLIFKGRYRRAAMLAAASRRNAKAIIRSQRNV